ncbi:MAG: L,D-transpeptidase [Polyangiaceae bacterium]|nr:L,D-transpeptidase [Polyangiaceae bacterium]
MATTPALFALAACGADATSTRVPRPPFPATASAAPSAAPAQAAPGRLRGLDAGAKDAHHDTALAPARDEPGRPRIGSVSHFTWIYGAPSRHRQPIGYLRPGTSVSLRDESAVTGQGCSSGRWLKVEPRGFVCEDVTVVRDLQDTVFRALSDASAPSDRVLPYRYAYSTGAPMYGKLPSPDEQRAAELRYTPVDKLPRSGKPRSGYEELATYELLEGTDPLPWFVAPGAELPRMRGYDRGVIRKHIPFGSLLSFSRALHVDGRTYLLSPNLTLVPADRMRPFGETQFRGVAIGDAIKPPFAWTRSEARSKYRARDDGYLEVTSDTWPPRTVVLLTGKRATRGTQAFLETREPGVFIRERDASVVPERAKLPWGAGPTDKWIDFAATSGTFTLFVGDKPVYSTLGSPGAGGPAPHLRMSAEDLVKGSYTPLGVFRITFKTRTSTMSPEAVPNPKDHWIQDVPYTQYFERPFAIHTAYWHEDFGQPKSGGCINLSPIDAHFVFGWTAPAIPPEWSGVSSSGEMGLGTILVVRR